MATNSLAVQASQDEMVFRPQGKLESDRVIDAWRRAREQLRNTSARRVTMDLGDVDALDSSGVAFLRSVESFCKDRGLAYEERNVPDHIAGFLDYIRAHARQRTDAPATQPPPGMIEAAGLKIAAAAEGGHAVIEFLGQFLISTIGRTRSLRQLHVGEFFYQLQQVGVNALPLIIALSFMLGMFIVFQGSLRNIGPAIFVANMVVLAVTRAMAPMVVAITVAGRSGSAFASEIGTMKVNNELEAITVMNIDIVQLIVLPRVAALAVAEPLLTMIADAIGVMGGMVTAYVHLNVPPIMFLHNARGALQGPDIFTGLIKSCTSGMLTGFIGCYCGLKTGSESGSVGIQTTTSVVYSIFAVIAVDTVYSYIFSLYGW